MTYHPSVEELGNSMRMMVSPCFVRDPCKVRRVHCDRACGFDELVRSSAAVCHAAKKKHGTYRMKEGGNSGGGTGCLSQEIKHREFDKAPQDPDSIDHCYVPSATYFKVCNVIGQPVQVNHPGFVAPYKSCHQLSRRLVQHCHSTSQDQCYNVLNQRIKSWTQSPASKEYDCKHYYGSHYNVLGQKIKPCYSMPPLEPCSCRTYNTLGQTVQTLDCKPSRRPECKMSAQNDNYAVLSQIGQLS